MNEELLTYIIGALVLGIAMGIYLRAQKRKERLAREAAERGQVYTSGPRAQHPQIDVNQCIGCQSCTMVCPEGDVLGMVGGKAAFTNPHKCIGHSLCADACPVGAITMKTAQPGMSADLPNLTSEYETNLTGLFIVGELGGLALIKNAVNQGRDCIDTIHERLSSAATPSEPGVYDVVIVGAGPAGISAALRAIEQRLNYLLIEQEQIGGTVAKYPRQKLVMTSPVDLPLYGKFNKTQVSKESLLALWQKVSERADLRVQCGTRVIDIQRTAAAFSIQTQSSAGDHMVLARNAVLALGRTGTPRKLGVPGEELGKVMYRLIEADHYTHKRILIVGGGDSAVEAAMGLANQVGNRVTLSYRQAAFSRLKDRNEKRVEQFIRDGKLEVIFNSRPVEIRTESVTLDVAGTRRELENDFVWIFAGGTPPNDFLKKIGVAFGAHDVTAEAHKEAYEASLPAAV